MGLGEKVRREGTQKIIICSNKDGSVERTKHEDAAHVRLPPLVTLLRPAL